MYVFGKHTTNMRSGTGIHSWKLRESVLPKTYLLCVPQARILCNWQLDIKQRSSVSYLKMAARQRRRVKNSPSFVEFKCRSLWSHSVIKCIFTCSDLRSCQVYGSKSMVSGVRCPSVCPLLVQPYIIFACMVFCGYLDIWTADVNFGKMIMWYLF